MIGLGLRNPYLAAVFALLLLVLGVVAWQQIPTDLLPVFRTPAVQVLTLYPGMPAEVVEKDITSRLERWTGQANGIASQDSKSLTGVSVVRNHFREDIDPNTALSQVTSLAMSDLYYLPPGTIPPMIMPFDPTASIPLCLLSVSSDRFSETELYDLAYFDLRNRLQGISGVIAPAVFGGRIRRILVYGDPLKMRSRDVSLMDLSRAINRSNVMIPLGSMKIGEQDMQFDVNGMVHTVAELEDIPVRMENGAPIFLGDVAEARDSSQIQSNIVRVDGKRQLYVPIYRQPGANTIGVVDAVKAAVPEIVSRLPEGIELKVVMDQSVYVRESIDSLLHESAIGALLAGLMVLLFLGSARSTLIVCVAIPLSVLAALAGLRFTGNSLNAMTLGGLALAVGRLVDDAIVVLENVHRHLRMGKSPLQAAADGTREVAMPVLVATLTTIVVFAPVIYLAGLGSFLFTPLALAVALAIGASYVVAMFVVPAACSRFLGAHGERAGSVSPGERLTLRLTTAYRRRLATAFRRPVLVLAICALALVGGVALLPALGTELFPAIDAGQFVVRVRAPSGTRLEVTEQRIEEVEHAIRELLPPGEIVQLISNIGVLYDWPAAYTPNAGPMDAFIMVQLADARTRSAQEWTAELRRQLPSRSPGLDFSFESGGLVTAALNAGLPSPINVQVEGNDLRTARDLAERVRDEVAAVPGTADVRIEQRLDYPQMKVDVDRVRAGYLGLDQGEIVRNIVSAMNSSVTFSPGFWIDPKNGNHYFIGVQYAEDQLTSLDTIRDVALTGNGLSTVSLRQVADFRKDTAPSQVNHRNISRVIDVFANVDGRDVGSVAADIDKRLVRLREEVASQPRWKGYSIHSRGEVSSMRESFKGLAFGLLLASVLVYLVMVAQFRSFLDPLLVMTAVPLGGIGVIFALWLTGMTINIQSLLGVLFMVGISVSNGVLVVDFANQLRQQGHSALRAALQAATIRLRPILMTSVATVLGLLPMAIGIGRGSEGNVPLARAVIGGLLVSTLLTLFLLPLVWSYVTRVERSPVRPECPNLKALCAVLLCVQLGAAQDAQRTVDVVRARQQDMVRTVRLSGSVEPWEETVLAARVSGYVRELAVDRGDRVQAGDVIAVIDVPEMAGELQRAHAMLAEAQAEADLAVTLASWQRATHDADPGAVSELELAMADAKALASIAHRDAAKSELTRLEAMATLASIVAPFAGVISERFVSPGALVQSSGQATSIARLVQLDRLRVIVDLPDSESGAIAVGHRAYVAIQVTGHSVEGAVGRISGQLDAATRTLRLEVDLENRDRAIRPGLFADVTLELDRHAAAVVVPNSAVLTEKRRSLVFVVVARSDGYVVERRQVETGIDDGITTEILSGLLAGDLVATVAGSVREGEGYAAIREKEQP